MDRESPEAKIDEAQFFADMIEQVEGKKINLLGRPATVVANYFFSAFLCAALSVFEYVATPAAGKKASMHRRKRPPTASRKVDTWKHKWRFTTLGDFFYAARDRNIHLSHQGTRGPRPWAPAMMTEETTATFSGERETAEGALEFHSSAAPPGTTETRATVLCREYVEELKKAVADAKVQGLV